MSQTHPRPEELTDYVHGALASARDAAVHAHLAECSACARAYEAEAALTEVLRAHARAEERELPDRVVAAVRASVERPPRESIWQSLRGAFRPMVFIPVAAAVAVALYFGVNAWRAAFGATPIDAAYYVNNHAALTAGAPFSEDAPVPAMLTSDDAADQPPDEQR